MSTIEFRRMTDLNRFSSTGNIGGNTPSRSIRALAFAKKPPANATTAFDVSTTRATHPDTMDIHVQVRLLIGFDFRKVDFELSSTLLQMDTLTTGDSHDQRKAISDVEMALDSKKVVL